MQLCNDFSLTDQTEFIRRVHSGEITLPYKRSYTSDAEIALKFEKLRALAGPAVNERESLVHTYTLANLDFKAADLSYRDIPKSDENASSGEPSPTDHHSSDSDSPTQVLIISKNTDYKETGAISDMFQEHNRLKARFSNSHESPHDFFYKYPEIIAADCASTAAYAGVMNPYNVREALYWKSSECSAFNPVIMLYFINKYSARSVLDPCAGWGDRLIAAMAAGIRYVGVDPNENLFDGYQNIHNFFSTVAGNPRITLICSTIQNADLPVISGKPEMFDMVFTSPPYWNLEEYTGAGRVTETSESSWLWNFLWPMLDICISRINPGGHLVLNLNQRPRQTYIARMLEYMRKKSVMKYLGVISYTDTRIENPQPVWIWHKLQPRAEPAPCGNSEQSI